MKSRIALQTARIAPRNAPSAKRGQVYLPTIRQPLEAKINRFHNMFDILEHILNDKMKG